MKIGIMQPYFFPYIGYWQLMNYVDQYVVFDDVNYINRGWINRNRILVNGEAKYFNLPMLGASQNKRINEISINQDPKLRNRNLQIIKEAYHKAPYFKKVYPIIERVLLLDDKNLALYLKKSFEIINEYLEISTKLILSSAIDKDDKKRGQEKIIEICYKLSGDQYINAIGGQELYDYDLFKENGIKLSFLATKSIEYEQLGNEFVSNLSIIDVMMFNDKISVRKMLNLYTLITR